MERLKASLYGIERSPKIFEPSPSKLEHYPSEGEGSIFLIEKGISEVLKAPSEIEKGVSEVLKAPSEIEKAISQVLKAPSEIEKGVSEVLKAPSEIEKAISQVLKAPSEIEKGISEGEKSSSGRQLLSFYYFWSYKCTNFTELSNP